VDAEAGVLRAEFQDRSSAPDFDIVGVRAETQHGLHRSLATVER
jgi:hypothetical protein